MAEEMALLGFPLDRVARNSLVLACCRAGDTDRAMELVEDMKVRAMGMEEQTAKQGGESNMNKGDLWRHLDRARILLH